MFFDRGNHYEFLSLGQELAAPGELQHPQTFDFNFKNVEKQYESYNGINVKLRYFVRVTVSRRMADVVREKDLWVYSYRIPPETNSSIKMDVGIEDCLHIEFEYSKSKYHLKDVIVGRIYFLLVRLKIKHMELSIIRRETTGAAPNQYNESETLVRFEIMDGSPSRGTHSHESAVSMTDKTPGETIPIRLFLGGFDLTPTFREVNKKYSTRYYLSLVLIDEGMAHPHTCTTVTDWLTLRRRAPILQAVRNCLVPTSTRRLDVGPGAEQANGSIMSIRINVTSRNTCELESLDGTWLKAFYPTTMRKLGPLIRARYVLPHRGGGGSLRSHWSSCSAWMLHV